MMKYFDAHAHIEPKDEQDCEKMKGDGLVGYVYNAIDLATSRKALLLAEKFPGFIRSTLGLHPDLLIPGSEQYDENYNEEKIKSDISDLRKLFEQGKDCFVAIGECGLDFYWLERNQELSKKEKEKSKKLQKMLFEGQIELAIELGLPLVVHPRGAEEESLDIVNSKLKAHNSKLKALFHSYTGSLEVAKKILEAGHYLSFNGILTFKGADDVREIFRLAWTNYAEQVLAETDSPYLAPEPKRGEQNSPEYVRYVITRMADIVRIDVKVLATKVYENAMGFLKL